MAWTGAVMLVAISILLGVCAAKIHIGTLHRNSWMGIRVPATYASEEAWQAAHRRALPWFVATTVLGFAGAVGLVVAALHKASDTAVLPWFIGLFVAISVLILAPVPSAIRAANHAH